MFFANYNTYIFCTLKKNFLASLFCTIIVIYVHEIFFFFKNKVLALYTCTASQPETFPVVKKAAQPFKRKVVVVLFV